MQYRNAPCSKGTVHNILQVYDIEATNVSLTMNDHSNTSHVAPTGNHSDITNVKRNKISDLVLLNVKLD